MGGDQHVAAVRGFLETVIRPGATLDAHGDDDNLIDAGVLDSFALIQVIFFLESEYGIDLQARSIDPQDLVSVGGIVRAITKDAT